MNKNFDLFLLHCDWDIHPRTWICLGGKAIKIIFRDLERNVLRKQDWSREKLSKKVAEFLDCSHSTIRQTLQVKREFYPIPIILELLKLSQDKKKFLKKFGENIEYLKVNSASAKPIKAIYKVNENLAKILGAFMADGSLSIQVVIATSQSRNLRKVKQRLEKLKINHSTGHSPSRKQYYISIQANKNNLEILNQLIVSYSPHFLIQTHCNIELSEEYKDSVKAFIGWIREEFEINPNSFRKKRNAWRVIFSNKILARYLMCLFEVIPGTKTYSAFEPEIIKKSNLKIRKAFAKGALMFDGCVTKKRNVSFNTKSSKLHRSIKEIWERDKISFGERVDQRKDRILLSTVKNKEEKLLDYFEKDTQKWKLFKWLSGDLNQTPILKESSFLSSEKILKVLQKVKACDVDFLRAHFDCADLTIRVYLEILKRQGRIKLSKQLLHVNNCVSQNTSVFLKNKFHKSLFSKIRKRFKKDKNFANFLEVHKATLSAWRVRKNRIPLSFLKETCQVLDIKFEEVLKNINQTDRKIVEII